MNVSIIVLIIAAAIAATRSRADARWPLWAAGTMAVLPFIVRYGVQALYGADIGSLNGALTSYVAWPVACALLAGWLFRASRSIIPDVRARKR